MKKKLAIILICMMIFTLWPPVPMASNLFPPLIDKAFALDVGNGGIVTTVKFIKQHSAYNVSGGNIIINGTNLEDINVLFEVEGGVPTAIGTLHQDSSEFFLNYVFNAQEADSFTGRIYIGNKIVNLNTPTFPNITGADKSAVNQDAINGDQQMTVFGANLDKINNVDIKATYGRGISQNNITNVLPPNANSITFSPTAPGVLGYQDITLNQVVAGNPLTGSPDIEVTYYYDNPFRILQDLALDPVDLYPNAASKGDIVTLSSDFFSDARTYKVYFLAVTDNDFAFADSKLSPSVTLSQDKKKLFVQVPTTAGLELGTKRIVIVEVLNNEIVSRFNVPEQFSLVDAVYKPTVTRINPARGSDEGTNVQIIGRNLLAPNIPELLSNSGAIAISTALPGPGNEEMRITYDPNNVTFKGDAVTSVTREITVLVSKPAQFEVVGGNVRYSKIGADDYLYINTAVIDDAATDPFKDVVLEINTRIIADGKTFDFTQTVNVKDGFEFVPSSIEPVISKITPDQVQINPNFTPKENTLLSIEGSNFMVNKYTDANGVVRTNYPVILFQITNTLGDDNYIVKFDKSDTTGTPQGTIYDKNKQPIAGLPVDMVVLNNKNEIVDGSVGNDLGSRIVVYLLKTIDLDTGGKKNLQIINPKRNSEDLGIGKVVLDYIDFVQPPDTPVIETVSPNIVTADSLADIFVTGSNFQEGVKVYIDGIDVGAITRAVDPEGAGMTLKFKAPKGRITKTQLEVVNPLGGLAVSDFYYVQSFNQDPKITSVAPNKGTVDTLVVMSGDNFFKPDPAAVGLKGLDAFRLLGTRVYLDGKDINSYQTDAFGDVDFKSYTSPASNMVLFSNSSGVIQTSPFYRNAQVTQFDDSIVYEWAFDTMGNPQLSDGSKAVYTFKYNDVSNEYEAYDGSGALLGTMTFTAQQIDINGTPTLKIRLNNQLVRAAFSLNKELHTELADYWNSVILKDQATADLFTLTEQPDGTVKLTNGQLKTYTLTTAGTIDAPIYKVVDASQVAHNVAVSDNGIVVTLTTGEVYDLRLLTPYVVDGGNQRIIGNRMRVENRNKLIFYVPNLVSSTGLKDVRIVNPDTKDFTLKQGFYYYQLPGTQPTITSITPNSGSVEGGYIVSIKGKDFRDNSSVYFDGILVPVGNRTVNLDGTEIQAKVPEYPIDIATVFGVGKLTVPVVVVNTDGGSAYKADGFTYVKPASQPKLTQIILNKGSTNGGEIVEIIGEDFRFFEPYKNFGGTGGYDEGIDTFTNLNSYLTSITPKWDNLQAKRYDGLIDLWEKTPMPGGANYYGYDYYYASQILPKIYFGTEQAKIVDFGTDYIKVITPSNGQGVKNVILMNNDSGVSNALPYTYQASNPTITYINPTQGARTGGERREIVGSGFSDISVDAYLNDDATTIVDSGNKVEALVRFGAITNEKIAIGQPNDGRINANRATVNLEGGLKVAFDGNAKTLDVTLEEAGVIYTRTFSNYNNGEVYIPAGMLKSGANYYQPAGYGYATPTVFNADTDYEWFRVSVDTVNKRLIFSRGYAPKVDFETFGKLVVYTPSYYTVDTVPVTLYSPDGGQATTTFKFTNPASKPIIEMVNPFEVLPAGSSENNTAVDQRMVQSTVNGGISIEIKGTDFRDGLKVYLGTKPAEVLDITEDKINNLQVIIARVPQGTSLEIGNKLPIIVENTDGGIANSADVAKLGTDKRLIYFIYRKPLSLPVIKEIVPNQTSQFGGNTVEIRGTDFRQNARIIIGSIGGVPVTPSAIESVGRYVRFVVPTSLTPGKKDIQVINTDFGTVTMKDGLEVISYPTVNNDVRTEDGTKAINILLTTGGEKIKITGQNFAPDVKVYFGGTRVAQIAGQTGVIGFYKDDKKYVIQGATLSPEVKFVDSTTLIVTTPEVYEEKDYTITIVNADTGLSDSNAVVRFSVPVPSAPTSLKAQVVDKQYIRLYDYLTERVKYYEIYVYMGAKTTAQLMANNYKDFKSLGTTTLEPYKISRLDGFSNLTASDSIFFVVKAVNEYGSSSWSNIATVGYSQFKEVKALGDPNLSGSLLPTLEQVASSSLTGNALTVLFTDKGFTGSVVTDLTGQTFVGLNQTKVIMPDNMVASNTNRMTMNGLLIDTTFMPFIFNNSIFKANNTAGVEYVTYKASWVQDANTGAALVSLPSAYKAVSPVITLGFEIANNNGTRNLGQLVAPLDLVFNTKAQAITVKTGPYVLYYYNLNTRQWQIVTSTYNSSLSEVTTKAQNPGYYVLTVKR